MDAVSRREVVVCAMDGSRLSPSGMYVRQPPARAHLVAHTIAGIGNPRCAYLNKSSDTWYVQLALAVKPGGMAGSCGPSRSVLLQIGQGAPAPPQSQAPSPKNGRRDGSRRPTDSCRTLHSNASDLALMQRAPAIALRPSRAEASDGGIRRGSTHFPWLARLTSQPSLNALPAAANLLDRLLYRARRSSGFLGLVPNLIVLTARHARPVLLAPAA